MKSQLISTDISNTAFTRLRRGQKNVDVADLPEMLQRKVRAQVAGGGADSLLSRQFNPFIQRMSLEEPRSWEERVRWKRYFYQTDPLINAAIQVHSQFPLSNLHIQHEDEEIREFFDDMLDELDFFEFLVDFNTEFNITGEVIPYGVFDNDKNPGIWKGFILINPVNATIEGSEFAQGAHKDVVILRLDPKLRRIVDNPRDPVLGPLCEKLSPDIVQAIRTGQGLRLDPVQVSRLRRPGSYFSRRSASMIDCVFRDLMYREKLRSAQYAIADRHITPREFYFIGDENNVADQAELDNFRAALASSWTDVNSAIVYHHAVRVQIEGSSGKILPIWPEMEATDKRIMVGMEINESMIMGDSSSFATSVVGYDVVISRWLAQRQRIEKWMRRNVFGPICKIHKMYVPENKIKSSKYRAQAGLPRPLWIPEVRWEKQHLRDESARLDLLTKLVVSKQIPIEMLYDLLELETKTVEDMVDKEIERQATRKKKLVERLTKLQLLQFADFGAQKDDGSGGGGGMTMPPGMDGGGGGALPSSALGGGDAGGPPGGDMPDVAGQDMDSPSAGLANGLPGGPQAVTGASPAAGGSNPQPGANSVL